MKLDQNIHTSQERVEYIKQNLTGKETPQELQYAANYILFAEKDKKIISDNRNITLTKREVSFEGICSKLENGENGIYNLASNLGKQAYLTQKKPKLTEQDYEEIPGLKEIRDIIERLEKKLEHTPSGKKYPIKKQLIDLYQLRYTLKNEYISWMHPQPNKIVSTLSSYSFEEKITITADGDVTSNGVVNLFNPKHISAILCNYSKLRENNWDNFMSDSWYLLLDFDTISEKALAPHPIYESIVTYKIDGKSNAEIQELLLQKHGLTYSNEYISSLWRNKIPKLIAEKAKEEYLIWYYTYKEYGKWKKCSRCREVKLAHNRFFSKNSTSKDGWYSMCKECRNKKNKKEGK